MGPQAGFDLASKITSATTVKADQDHHSLVVLSFPSDIPDRSEFLLGETPVNPSDTLFRQLQILDEMDVAVAAIACNTAHASPIIEPVKTAVVKNDLQLQLLDLIEQTVEYIRRVHPAVERVGVLGTRGTYQFKLYDVALENAGLQIIRPDVSITEEFVFPAIYDPGFGIKTFSNPVTETARDHVGYAIKHLSEKNAELVILGCTELPLVFSFSPLSAGTELNHDVILIDPAVAMAEALIRFVKTL